MNKFNLDVIAMFQHMQVIRDKLHQIGITGESWSVTSFGGAPTPHFSGWFTVGGQYRDFKLLFSVKELAQGNFDPNEVVLGEIEKYVCSAIGHLRREDQ